MASLARRQLLTMARYNIWANSRLHESISNLSERVCENDMKLPFRSIRGSLNHMVLAEVLWYARFTGAKAVGGFELEDIAQLWRRPTNSGQWEEIAVLSDVTSAIKASREQSARWVQYIDKLDDASLDSEFTYMNTSGKQLTKHRAMALMHVFNHGTHHRGQITAALTALGQSAPQLDLIYFLDEKP